MALPVLEFAGRCHDANLANRLSKAGAESRVGLIEPIEPRIVKSQTTLRV
jgi:hypothetical protein